MNAITVRPNLHFCDIDGAYVFLDLDAQRYFLLGNAAAARFRHFLDGVMTDEDRAWLVDNRLLRHADAEPLVCQTGAAVEAAMSTMDEALPRANVILTLQIILAQLATKRRLRRKPLKTLLQELRDDGNIAGNVQDPTLRQIGSISELSRIVAAFRASERISNSINQCLPRGIALFTLLRRRGFSPKMVIGVTLPFAAHCWVQVGDRVVSDSLDRVQSFTPILAI